MKNSICVWATTMVLADANIIFFCNKYNSFVCNKMNVVGLSFKNHNVNVSLGIGIEQQEVLYCFNPKLLPSSW